MEKTLKEKSVLVEVVDFKGHRSSQVETPAQLEVRVLAGVKKNRKGPVRAESDKVPASPAGMLGDDDPMVVQEKLVPENLVLKIKWSV